MRSAAWRRRVALGAGLWLVYAANGREIGAGDTVPAMLQPIALARRDGVALDRFVPVLRARDPAHAEPGRFPPYYASVRRGRLVSRYPLAPALLTLPLIAPQVAVLDRMRPGWDAAPASTVWYARRMAKNASAVVAASTGVLVFEALVRLGLAGVAWPATLVAALGSPLWGVASQSAWHHGPGAAMLALAIALLAAPPRPGTLAGAGLALAALVAVRVPAAVFALPLCAVAVWRRPGAARWLVPPLAIGTALLVAYNVWLFGTPAGGQAEMEAARLALHGVTESWGRFTTGAAGTLWSPGRGLLVYCPWVAATILAWPWTRPRLGSAPIVAALLVGLAAHLVVFAKYSGWWAGWSFGPRYWTEAVPALAILYAFALEGARTRARWARAPLLATGALAIVVQALGAAYYPSSWNALPENVDHRHERLWDWRDTELARGLREGPHPREFRLLPW
jgi:hypothetical protein